MPKTKKEKEKRLKRFRGSPTIKISERIQRAVHQRLFLVEISTAPTATCPRHGGPLVNFTVLGSTGNVYTVTLSKVPTCNCPDAIKGNLCKHLLFVMIKVVGLPSTHQLVYQSAYLTEELDQILSLMRQRTAYLGRENVGGIVANEAVRRQHDAIKRGEASSSAVGDGSAEDDSVKDEKDEDNNGKVSSRKEVEGDCPICFDSLLSSGTTSNTNNNLSQLTYCRGACGSNFHKSCIQIWTGQPSQRGRPTCPACRQPWVDNNNDERRKRRHNQQQQHQSSGARRSPSSGVRNEEGYENLGSLQGQSPVRDTSTYHSSPYYGYKRRRYY